MVAVLLAPGPPLRAYIGLGAFLECRCCAVHFRRLGLLPRLAASLDDVHAGCAAIALHAQPSRVAGKSCVFEGYVFEGTEAVPTFFAVRPSNSDKTGSSPRVL